jgi:hypothetical protein
MMAGFAKVHLNTTRNVVRALSPDAERSEAARHIKMFLVPRDIERDVFDSQVPDMLVTNSMVDRYLEIEPPIAAVIPEFQRVIEEIERSYVLGHRFAALAASCAGIERVLNLARIRLHKHHRPIKRLWSKGPKDDWNDNIDALAQWGYLDDDFARELHFVYQEIRCKYLHSGPIQNLDADSLRSVRAAYRLLTIFLGFPQDLFDVASGFRCRNAQDPRFVEFYKPEMSNDPRDASDSKESG